VIKNLMTGMTRSSMSRLLALRVIEQAKEDLINPLLTHYPYEKEHYREFIVLLFSERYEGEW